MTTKEYKARIKDINDRIASLKQEKCKIQEEYLDSLPFRVGDYVHIDGVYIEEDVWISRMQMEEHGAGLNLYVNKRRKDGTRSKAECLAYHVNPDNVRLVDCPCRDTKEEQ